MQTARNVYGTNLLSRTADGQTYTYMYNGHADVTALLKADGTISATYYYDAFGNITDTTGAVNNSITYAGYQYDKETGLYYLNARYYDPKVARFLTEDTHRGNKRDPLSLNLYTYCSNNPIRYKDPTGHWQQGDENLSYSARIEISRLTDLYWAAKTQAERDTIHAAADDIRKNNKPESTPQNSVTGQNANSILATTSNRDANGQAYMTASQWNSISTTKNDAVVKAVLKDGAISQTDVIKVATSKPSDSVSNISPIVSSTRNQPIILTQEQIQTLYNETMRSNTPHIDIMLLSVTTTNGNGLTRTQNVTLERLNNIINDHLTEGDFSGTLRDLQGNPVPKPGGGYYDHKGEMDNSLEGLQAVKRSLDGSLKNPNLDAKAKQILEDALNRVC